MRDESILYMSASDLAESIRNRKISPVEVIGAILDRIDQINPIVNAFCTYNEEQIRLSAKAAESALYRGEKLGPLHGVPVSIKDLICTKGLRTTFGSKLYENYIPEFDDIVVTRLKAAGAIILGKTNTSEFGYKAVTDNLIFGGTRNPWNIKITAGGSSGGAAAAVASGMGPIGIGNDAGGSIRIPASFCGVFGFKPSRGVVPVGPILPGWQNMYRRLVHTGPITRTVQDSALVMDVIGGRDRCDYLSSVPMRVEHREEIKRPVRDFNIAWCPELGQTVLEREVLYRAEQVLTVFAELKCYVEKVDLRIPCPHEAFQLLFAADCAAALGDDFASRKAVLEKKFIKLIIAGLEAKGSDCAEAANRCHLLCNEFQNAFEKYDLIVTPTVAVSPFSIDMDWPRLLEGKKVHALNYIALTYPFNLLGWPAASIPWGLTNTGLPVGLQIIGKLYEDAKVLRAAATLERARLWSNLRPYPGRQNIIEGGSNIVKGIEGSITEPH